MLSGKQGRQNGIRCAGRLRQGWRGQFRDGKTTRRDAVEAARNLIGQGMEGATIKDENGRVYVPAEFDAFLNGE
jgi:hypothetical protein